MSTVGVQSVQAFFHEAICEAIRNQGVSASESTEFYLVNLLSDFASSTVDDAPLALKLAEAKYAQTEERVRQLRRIGDQSLYVSGFFSDSLRRKAIDVSYYVSLGGTAYGQLATHFRAARREPQSGVYEELQHNFRTFVDVLSEISERTSSSSMSVIQLYERWLATGSEWMERRLRAHGLLGKGSS